MFDHFRLVTWSCPTLCSPMDWSMPGFPVHHQLPEFTQPHVHRGGDTIAPSHPLSPLSPPAFNLSQLSESFQMSQFFTSGGQRTRVSASASVLPMNILDWFPLGLTGISLQSMGLSKVFSNTTVQKHQFFSTQLSLQSSSHIHIWLLSSQSYGFSSSYAWMYGCGSSSSLSAIRVVSSAYLRLLIFLPAIFIPAYDSSSTAFYMMYSAYELNKQGDVI